MDHRLYLQWIEETLANLFHCSCCIWTNYYILNIMITYLHYMLLLYTIYVSTLYMY